MTTQKQSIIPRFRPGRPQGCLVRLAVLACLLLALFAPGRAQAVNGALMTGKALAVLCSSKEEKDVFACQTYIAGVIDYHRLIRGLGVVPSVDFCLPKDLTMEQVRRIVYNYLIRRNEHHDFIAAPAVAMSLYQYYPCKRRRR